MGQGQSSTPGTDMPAQEQRTDFYELLGVERTAADDEIKRAYKKKALELHPDRNFGNVEDATKLFAEISSAYEVLSDPQERAWYDSHRDHFLGGSSANGPDGEEYSYNVRMTTADDVLKLMLRYNIAAKMDDSPHGFFGGLNDFFAQLAKEEDAACQWEDQEPIDYAPFGHRNDEYDDVVRPFYAAWNGFATRKSYAWKDVYRLSDAQDRRIRRLMEKENAKIRQEAKQEFNDAVRSLVAFVRKRDTRYQENQKSEAERQKILKDAAQAQAQRARQAKKARLEEPDNMAVPDWAKSNARDEHEGGFSSESDVEEHVLECVACDKSFKSEAQFKAHEKSKKHLKALKQLQKKMRDEGHDLDIDDDAGDKHETLGTKKSSETKGSAAHTREDEPITDSDGNEKVSKNKTSQASQAGVIVEGYSSSASVSNDDYAPRSEVESRLTEETASSIPSRLKHLDLDSEATPATSDNEMSASQSKVGKAKQKRAKKAAQQAAGETNKSGVAEFRCAVCQSGFPSRTRLFIHIKEKGHAALVSQVKIGSGKKKGKNG